MQTLSLKTPQAAQNVLADVVNKASLNGNGLTSGSEKTPFQHELSKQVQARRQSSEAVQLKSASAGNPSGNQPNSQAQATENASEKAENSVATTSAASAERQPTDIGTLSSPDAASMLLALQSAGKMDGSDISAGLNDKEKLTAEMLSVDGDSANANVAALVSVNTNLVMSAKGEKISASELNPDLSGRSAVLADNAAAGTQQKLVGMGAGNLQSQYVDDAPEVESTVVDAAAGKLQGRLDNAQDKSASKAAGLELAANRVAANVSNESASRDFSSIMTAASQSPAMQSGMVQVASASNLAAAQQAGSSTFINAYPGKAGWDQAISQRVVWMVGAGEQSATLTLNPPELGPLKVVIQVHNQQADATFISDNDEVRRALESGISNLREKMNESGVQLGQANVSTSSQSQQNFQQAGQGRTAGQGHSNVQANQAQSDSVASERVKMRTNNGLVDTFA